MKLHHIGYAVNNILDAIASFKLMGFSLIGDLFSDSRRKVNIALISNGKIVIELIAPNKERSPVNELLERNGPGAYHICYEVNDIQKEIERLKQNKFKVIEDVKEAPALGSAMVAFLYNRHLGLIELVQFD